MFILAKYVFLVLLSSSRSLATTYTSLNNEPCIIRPTFFDFNPVEIHCYPFMMDIVDG